MKNKKLQLAALGVVLVVVIVVGVLLLRGMPKQEGVMEQSGVPAENPTETQTEPDGTAVASAASAEELTYYQITWGVHEDDVQAPGSRLEALKNIFFFENQVCCFTYRAEGAVDIVAMGSGEVLCSFGPEALLDPNIVSLCVDETETVWELYTTEEGDVLAAPCGAGVSQEDAVVLGTVEDFGMGFDAPAFEVQQGVVLLQGDYGMLLWAIDTNTGEARRLTDESNQFMNLCLDGNGTVYYMTTNNTDQISTLWKYDLETGEAVEIGPVTGIDTPWTLSYTEGVGLFIRDSMNGIIYEVDTETGAARSEFADMRMDMIDPPDVFSTNTTMNFLIDQQGRAYFNYYNWDFSMDPPIHERTLYAAELVTVSASTEEAVTLTITAPYQVDSIANAVRKYRQLHPEVQVVWDTQYVSREEFQLNWQEYKDQISLRIMTGDVGDLVMVTGSGLGTEIITDTDAFADLSAYLDACPFREDLIWNVIETLRGEDGAIRGLPVYILPKFLIWNMDLLEELGNPVDPDTVTWSELLDLALQWQADGTDLSLISTAEGYESSVEGFLLNFMLLANLYDAEQPDGSVQLDQPYLRELLTKFKALHGSTQLVRGDCDMNAGVETLGSKALFARSGSYYYLGAVFSTYGVMECEDGANIRLAAVPKGEVSQTQQGYAFCYGISAWSSHQDEAWELLQYIVSSEGLPANYTYTEDTVPLNTALQEKWLATEKKAFSDIPWFSYGEELLHQMQDILETVPFTRLDEPNGWYDAVYVPLAAYINGETTLDKAMETANANWERFVLE